MKSTSVDFKAYDLIPYPLVIFDNTKTYYLNAKARHLLKIPQHITDISTLRIDDFILPEYLKRIKSNNKKILQGIEFPPVELEIKDYKGRIIYVEAKSNAILLYGKKVIQSVFAEITDRKKGFNELQESKAILELIGKNSGDIILKYDYEPTERYSFVSDSAFNILGYNPQDWYKNKKLYEEILHPEDRKKFPKPNKAYFKYLEENQRNLSRFIHKNKSIVWLETSYNIVKNNKGKVVSIICLSRDVTKQKEVEAKLNITQDQLSLIANNAQDVIYFFTYVPKPKYIFISNSVQKVLGFKPEDLYKDPFFLNKQTPGKSNNFKEHEKLAAKKQANGSLKETKIDYQIKNAKGELVWMEDHINPISDKSGKINFLFGIVRNINDLKEKEKELNQKWSDYKLLLDQSPIAFFIHNNGVCLMCNQAALLLLKLKSEKKVIGVNIINYIHPEFRARALERMGMAMKGTEFDFIEYKITNSKNEILDVEIKTVPITYNGINAVLSPVKDITERNKIENARIKAQFIEQHNAKLLKEIELRKRAEKKIVEQTSRIKAIFESGNQTLWTINELYKYTSFNKKFAEVFYDFYGVYPKVSGALSDLKDPRAKAVQKDWVEKYKRVFKGESIEFFSTRINNKGTHHYMQFYLHPIYNSVGKIIEVYGLGKDITERVAAEKQTLNQAAKLEALFEGSSHYIWTVDTTNKLTSFNKNYTELIKKIYSTVPEINEPLNRGKMLQDEDYVLRMEENYSRAFAGHKINFELELLGKSDERVCLDVHLNPVFEEGKVIEVSGIAHDITATKQNEVRITQSLKEKEILLKEVHHRVKNNMQIISSILNLQSSYISDGKILNLLRESQNRIKTMAYIHESLYQNKTFSSINFNDYLTQLINNIIHSYSVSPDKMKLIVNCEKTILNLDTSIPLGLIINELVTNSIKHAFPDTSKGTISISLRTQNKFVFLTVEDNGSGISSEISTEKSGTLGLQLVYTLVDQIDGKISFDSIKPQGTKVNISFLI